MTARYFVVEGKTDEIILKRLLPDTLLQDTKIIVASGYSSALSIIQSLFAMTSLPVSFFFDTDTCFDDKIEEKKQFIKSYLKNISGNRFLLFPMKPEMEILLCYKKEVLEELVKRPITNELWQQAQYQPGHVLKMLIGTGTINFQAFLEKNLTPKIAQDLLQNPLLQQIIQQHSTEYLSNPLTEAA